jgi:excisionase family DNA binding protein
VGGGNVAARLIGAFAMPRKRRALRPIWPIAVSVKEAAECLSVTRRLLYEARDAGFLSFYRHGPTVRVLTADLVDYVRTHWHNEG